MLTLELMKSIQLTRIPRAQQAVAWILRANYRFPATRTKINIKGMQNMPEQACFLAMNHTDRFNCWPFQVSLWRDEGRFTATWVKGKYFNHPATRDFLVATNQIPAPSRGYVLSADYSQVSSVKLDGDLYRILKNAVESEDSDEDLHRVASAAGFGREIDHLLKTPRDMLGLDFNPFRHSYVERQRNLLKQMMDRFVELNQEAMDLGLYVLVFPEGTRSLTLGQGRPGMSQVALRLHTDILPIGCNGCDEAYPGDVPFSKGANIEYRVGKLLTMEDELKPFAIDEPYRPFTMEAAQFTERFDGATELVMKRLSELLEPRYLRGATNAVKGADRFM